MNSLRAREAIAIEIRSRSTSAHLLSGLCRAWLLLSQLCPHASEQEWHDVVKSLVMHDEPRELAQVVKHPNSPNVLHSVVGGSWACLSVVIRQLIASENLPKDCLGYTQHNARGGMQLATCLLVHLMGACRGKVARILKLVNALGKLGVFPVVPDSSDAAFLEGLKDQLSGKQIVSLCSVLYTQTPCRRSLIFDWETE